MELRPISVGEPDLGRRTAYFDILALDGSPAVTEAGGQPQVSISGGAFNPTGISVLTLVGFGLYSASLDAGILTNEGDIIRTRYKSGAVREARGDVFQVVNAATHYADPTSGAVSNLSYATVDEGDVFFSSRLNSASWTESSYDDRLKGLIEASQRISRLNFAGEVANPGQLLQFPRSNTFQATLTETIKTTDRFVPSDIKIACFLIAYKLLEGFDMDTEIENLTKITTRYHQVQTHYNRTFVPEYLRAGIPSAEAWSYLRPYLADPDTMVLTRVN